MGKTEKEKDKFNKLFDSECVKSEEIMKRISEYEIEIANIEKLKKIKENEILSQDRKISSLEIDINSIKKEINKISSSVNPYEDLLEKAVDELEKLQKTIENEEAKLIEIQQKISALEFWIKGFKDIRFVIIEDILANLEIQVNNYIKELGLSGWSITFDVEKDTKSGTITKGFHVFIKSPNNDAEVPWEAWSGGENQRLKLAGTLGISDLIMQSNGLGCNIMVLDEPTKHLSKKGIQNLLKLLYEYSQDYKKQIWIIDHHSLDFGNVEKVYTIVKDEEGSRIVENQ